MSLGVCIPDLIAQGKIPAKRAAEISALYDEFVLQHEGKFGRAAAESMATAQALKHLDRANLVKKRQALLSVQAQKGWLDRRFAETGDPKTERNAMDFASIEREIVALDKKIDTVRGSLFVTMDAMLSKHRRNLLGQVRDASDLEDVGRALFGESVSDLNAREMADSMAQVMEIARQRANAAGANIGKLDSYGLPQRHDSKAVRAVDFETWRSHPAIDRVKVRDIETGDIANGMRREDILRRVYETIADDGANKAKPGQMHAGAMANRRGDPRVLHFDSFNDWKEYQAAYGAGDSIYDIFNGHIGAMARDIALMEELGPNPAATVRFMQDWYEKSVGMSRDEKAINSVNGKKDRIGALVDEMTGANKLPANDRIALGFSALRSQQVAAKLGSAVLSAVPDFAMLLHNSRFNRVPINKVLGQYVKLWNPLDDGDRRLAVRLGLVTDDWINLSSSAARYTGEELTGEIPRRLAEIVIRVQGLARHTRNGQWAFGMEYLSHLTQMSDRSFANLDSQMQKQFGNNGISEADWDKYRATEKRIERGADWIMPSDAGRTGEKFLQMILTETDFAILMPDLRTRTMMNSNFKTGTWIGEIAKSALLFKSFPLSIYNLHGRRMMEQEGLTGKLGYAVPLLLMMVAGGGLSAQLKTIAAGKDPLPMDDPKFWGKATAQSGGLGLLGDLLYNSENSYGGGVLPTLVGPLIGQTLSNALYATAGNVKVAMDGDQKTKPEFVKDIAKTLEAEIPGRNLWYTRRAYDLLIADSIRRMTDPDFDDWVRGQQRRAAEEGTQYYAPSGQGLSGVRAPDLANAFGEVQ
jgi:hypothetical protein